MSASLHGLYFPPGSARVCAAHAQFTDGALAILGEDGTLLTAAPLHAVEISARLAAVPRRFAFADGSSFETPDNDGADILLRAHRKHASLLHRLESSWRVVAISILFAGAAAALFSIYGIPASARMLASITPDRVSQIIGAQALTALDGAVLEKSELTPEETKREQEVFARVAGLGKRGAKAYRLLPRKSDAMGPNAFALPDGSVIVTDALWKMTQQDAEAEGDRKSTRLNSSHVSESRMPSSA